MIMWLDVLMIWKLNEENPIDSNIVMDLTYNNIQDFYMKSFCAHHSSSLGYLGVRLKVHDVNKIDKCMLKQLKSDKTVIESLVLPDSEHLLMAYNQSIQINGFVSLCKNISENFIKQCLSNERYKCPKSDDFLRFTSWITGDPRLFSFRNKYELCSIGQNEVCFQYGNFLSFV